MSKHIAVIGGGYWGKNLIRNFYELGVLRTICDHDPSARTLYQQQYPGIEMSHELSDVLANPGIDALAIATPASNHAAHVRAALLAGKDVFVEKPLCLSESEGRELIDLARQRGLVLMTGHLLWYHPAIIKLQSLINGGELGRIQYIYSNRLNLGKLRSEENVLWSFAPHDVSVILGLAGEMPESVQARGGNFLHDHIADTTISYFQFPSGIHAHIYVSWLHPFKEQKLIVVGDRKMAVFDDTVAWPEKLRLYPHTIEWKDHIPLANKADAERVHIEENEPLRAECEHFLDCIEHRTPPRTDGEEGLRVLQVLNACQRSIQGNGALVSVSPEGKHCSYFAHPSAVIDDQVDIGNETRIWHFSHVLTGSRIGEQCNIGQNVVIGPHVHIGKGCKIQNNVSVYQGVTLEEHVFCGPSMVFTNVLNPRCEISRRDRFLPTLVKKGCSIGANATIVCGHTLGRYSFICAGAVVTGDVPDHALVVGNPARQTGWMCACGERLNGDSLACGACGKKYRRSEHGLEPLG
jgi:UDP-2-acetamido-3-amino-2,3-dideoxy-glucuronate N-acetyltransferase